jgi:four helix bundle protein
MAKTFKELVVWQKSHQLVLEIYKTTKSFPSEEKFGLTSDMRRAARSIPTNIVEGFYRKGHNDALRFFTYSEASLEELKYHTLLSLDLGYIDSIKCSELMNLEEEVGRLLDKWQKNYYPTAA